MFRFGSYMCLDRNPLSISTFHFPSHIVEIVLLTLCIDSGFYSHVCNGVIFK